MRTTLLFFAAAIPLAALAGCGGSRAGSFQPRGQVFLVSAVYGTASDAGFQASFFSSITPLPGKELHADPFDGVPLGGCLDDDPTAVSDYTGRDEGASVSARDGATTLTATPLGAEPGFYDAGFLPVGDYAAGDWDVTLASGWKATLRAPEPPVLSAPSDFASGVTRRALADPLVVQYSAPPADEIVMTVRDPLGFGTTCRLDPSKSSITVGSEHLPEGGFVRIFTLDLGAQDLDGRPVELLGEATVVAWMEPPGVDWPH